MAIGLGASLNTVRDVKLVRAVTSGLVLKSNFDTGEVTPISDGSVEFNGTSDYIDFSSKPIDTQPGTYCFWIKASDTGGNKGLFGHGAQHTGAFHIQYSSGRPLIYLASSYYQYFDDTGLGDDGKWHHYAVHLDPTDISAVWLYIDGIAVAKNGSPLSSSGAGNAYGNLEIGRTDAVNEFEGSLCNFGVWTGELTQAQIKSIMYKDYASLNTSEKTNLVSWWNLSADANDNHGSNNGTLS